MSRLEDLSIQFRSQQIAKNTYNQNDEFGSGHANALSDGDAKGKGELNGSVGSNIDIRERKLSITRNKYNNNNPYNDSNA